MVRSRLRLAKSGLGVEGGAGRAQVGLEAGKRVSAGSKLETVALVSRMAQSRAAGDAGQARGLARPGDRWANQRKWVLTSYQFDADNYYCKRT